MPETMSPREKVARIVDPKGWATRDGQYESIRRSTMHDKDRPLAFANADYYVRDSLDCADAILAALASSGDHAELARLADLLALYAEARDDEFTVDDVQLLERGADRIRTLIAEVAALREREKVRQIIDGALNSAIPEPWEVANHATDAIITALASGSGDHAELARLAEAATPGPWLPDYPFVSSNRRKPRAGRIAEVSISHKSSATFEANLLFIAAANPATVLALLAENAALREQVKFEKQVAYDENDRWQEAERKLDEAVGLLEVCEASMDAGCAGSHRIALNTIRPFLSKEAER